MEQPDHRTLLELWAETEQVDVEVVLQRFFDALDEAFPVRIDASDD